MIKVDAYRTLLRKSLLDTAPIMEKYSGAIKCAPGCSGCCRGLFYVSKLDILLIADAFTTLDSDSQKRAESKARAIKRLMKDLFGISKFDKIDDHMESIFYKRFSDTPCPFLSSEGRCDIYDSRPFICRLQGFPFHNGSRWEFESCCELNSALRTKLDRENDTELFRFDFKAFSQSEKRLFFDYGLADDYGKYYVIPDFVDML